MSSFTKSLVGGTVIALVALAAGLAAMSGAQTLVPSSAKPIGAVPSTITGKADANHLEGGAPRPWCATAEGVEWYTVKAPREAPMLAQVAATGGLEAVLVAYRISGSRRTPLVCRETGPAGHAAVAFYGYPTGSFLVGVGRRSGSPKGEFRLNVLAAEQPERMPGVPLPSAGVTSTVNSVLDRTDAWAVPMSRGTTYRLNLATHGNVHYGLYRPGTTSFFHEPPALEVDSAGYAVFTPGIDGGGTYTVVVQAAGEPVTHAYRLEVAPALADDTAPGVSIANGQVMSGTLAGRSLDTVDLYRFTVARAGELSTVRLKQRAAVGFDLLVLDELGRHVGAARGSTGPQVLRLHLAPAAYYAALQAPGGMAGSYSLQVQIRDITTTSVTVAGSTRVVTGPGASLPLSVHVTSASHGGTVNVQIDHFDPLIGWHFATALSGQVDSAGYWTTGWTPPSVGVFRVHARFVGNAYSSFSESGYATIHAAEPLE